MNFDEAGINASNLALIEDLYERYKIDPTSVAPAWKNYFVNLEQTPGNIGVAKMRQVASPIDQPEDVKIYNLIKAYRYYGHLLAKTNPLATKDLGEPWQLKFECYGFSQEDLSKEFPTCGLLKEPKASLQKILDTLKAIYTNRTGVEFTYSFNPEMEAWIQARIEPNLFRPNLSIEQKQTILQHLNRSELFEAFLHTKYPGQKRFSLEGGETLIPMLQGIIDEGTDLGAEDFVIGMAHRGRLNVLSNILEKTHVDIFAEFDENYIPDSFEGSGDVKYHKGFSSEALSVHGHKINIAVSPNPSHLESVDPVVEGQVKGKQIGKNNPDSQNQVIPILIHGDAAISGQGVVYETMQLSKLAGYSTGGTIHLVINNQIGFTTLPVDARSTFYCTDIAKTFGCPVFHVNAEDPEGCFYAALLAIQLRQKFHCDVFIDMNCYRKYGHNEGDEPAFTQPMEYTLIRKKKSIREIYRDDLISQGFLEKKMAEELENVFKNELQKALTEAKSKSSPEAKQPVDISKIEHKDAPLFQSIPTAVSLKELEKAAQLVSKIPEGFTIHPKLEHLIKDRLNMVLSSSDQKPVDWGMAETLAYATLLLQGKSIRLTGQDVGRGTFSHRHGIWVDQVKEQHYFPLQHLSVDQGRFDLINSPLSEFAALGFEYGYSTALPSTFVIWEAQFGDFSNGAQVIIDQFISTSEQKWGQKSSLTLLLPHGYEGQGPEHSSARMERYLTLAGNDNMTMANPSNPAQLFHLLRKRALNTINVKPLVIFTPKGLLRHPECVSAITDFTEGSFEEVLDDPLSPQKATKLVFCSGRIYYDLSAIRKKENADDIAIVRVEQLYPLHEEVIEKILKKYDAVNQIFWVQEEPKNMGAWYYIAPLLSILLPVGKKLSYLGRNRSASPAAGSYALHKKEHAAIMDTLFKKG